MHGHCTQCSQPCNRPPPTHASARDSWTLTGKSGSVSCEVTAPFSWVLMSTRFCLCPPRVCLPQSCVSSGGSIVGLMATSSKRAYAIPRSTAPRAPAPAAVHCWPMPPQETLRHRSVSVSVGSPGSGVHKVCLSPLSILAGMEFDSKMISPLLPSCWGFSFALGWGRCLLTVAPAPCSCCSSAYRLLGDSLPSDVACVLKVPPALCGCCSRAMQLSVNHTPRLTDTYDSRARWVLKYYYSRVNYRQWNHLGYCRKLLRFLLPGL